jgi:hypothetical protein
LQEYLPASQGSKAGQRWKVRQRTEEVPDLRDIHKLAGIVVYVLRLSPQNKAEEPKVQGEA